MASQQATKASAQADEPAVQIVKIYVPTCLALEGGQRPVISLRLVGDADTLQER
jgi:hypothetical protein